MFLKLYSETAGKNGVLVPVSDDCEIISMEYSLNKQVDEKKYCP